MITTRFTPKLFVGLVALLGAGFAIANPAPVQNKVQQTYTAPANIKKAAGTVINQDHISVADTSAVAPCSIAACSVIADFADTTRATADPATVFAVTTTSKANITITGAVIKDLGGTVTAVSDTNILVTGAVNVTPGQNGLFTNKDSITRHNLGTRTDNHHGSIAKDADNKAVIDNTVVATENTAQQSAAG